jgi:hypothetical protein
MRHAVQTTDAAFLETLASWLEAQPEILVLFRYSHAAGSRDFEFYSSFQVLADRIKALAPLTSVIAFSQPQLPVRGVVDEAFIERCLREIPDGAEYLIVETTLRVYGRVSWFHHNAGESHACLREDLQDCLGAPVAVGLHPPLDDTDVTISAVVPDQDGVARSGIY